MSHITVVHFIAFLAVAIAKPESRIIGGTDSSVTAHPYQVSIRYKNCSTCAFNHRCGGVVYSQRVLISSANCVSGVSAKNLLVVAGSNSIISTEGFIAPVQSYIVHEDYDSVYIDNDIALVILALDLPRGLQLIAPIQLAKAIPEAGSTGYVSGWGSVTEGGEFSENLKVTKVKIVSDDECKRSYGAARITENMLCAGTTEGGADSCTGDSGGPLVSGEQLVGIVSWGRGCGRTGYPGVYANVVALRYWIETNSDPSGPIDPIDPSDPSDPIDPNSPPGC